MLDITPNAFTNLPTEFRGRTIEGEALNQDVLRRAGIETADGVAVVTSSDSINAVVGHIARSNSNTPVVVVRNYDLRWRSMQEVFRTPAGKFFELGGAESGGAALPSSREYGVLSREW